MEIQHETTMATICPNCSSQVRPGINFCPHCGNPVKNLNSVMAGYHPVTGVEQEEAVLEKSDGFGYLTALTFPFRQQNWIEKLWWVMLAGFVPFFNLVLLSGWQMGLVKRMARTHRDLLPETSDLKTILA